MPQPFLDIAFPNAGRNAGGHRPLLCRQRAWLLLPLQGLERLSGGRRGDDPDRADRLAAVKRYNVGGYEHVRTITKPISGTVAIKVGGSPVTPVGIDHLTGRVTFGSAPGSAPTATFEFDVPVRFDTDKLPVQANAWDQQIVPQINLIEVNE